MDVLKHLGGDFKCRCGRQHKVPVRSYCYDRAVIENLAQITRDSLKPRPANSAAVVADQRTWAIAGKDAMAAITQVGFSTRQTIVPDAEGSPPVCDEQTCSLLIEKITNAAPDVVVAVGSGTINDLCKWSAFELKLPYIAVATAASMNGYAAANVAAAIGGVKVVLRAAPPVAVVAEPAVIENAPPEMTAAGFADTIAKFQSTADWVMNNFLFGEYYCAYCADILRDMEPLYLNNPQDLGAREPAAVKGLFDALFVTGVAMTMIGTSAPASGGEHLLSHVLDMTAQIDRRPHWLHGLQVGMGTIFSAALYERILNLDAPKIHPLPEQIDTQYWQIPALAAAVSKQYETKKLQLKTAAKKLSDRQLWQRLKETLRSTVKQPQQIRDWLHRAGAVTSIAQLGCPQAKLKAAILHMHEIRSRFSVVDLAWLLGILPDAADELIEQWLT